MRDFLPADVRRREYVIRRIKDVYERYGFEPLETPAVENIETLLGKYGEEGNQLIFKILKRGEHERTGEADLALRYDLTVPLARVVAEYGDKLPRFFKRYQIQPVWRADRPARGRFREFYQCDVDCIGTRSPVVEAELCAAASDALTKLGFEDFTIHLNHRQVLTAMLDNDGVTPDKHVAVLVVIDKIEKIGITGVMRELDALEIDLNVRENLINSLTITPIEPEMRLPEDESGKLENEERNAYLLDHLTSSFGNHEAGLQGVENLRRIVEYSAAYGTQKRIRIDQIGRASCRERV